MKSFTVIEIIENLIGPINPIGETNADENRFENLENMIELTNRLLFKIDYVSQNYADRQEYSMKKAGQRAASFMDEVKEEY